MQNKGFKNRVDYENDLDKKKEYKNHSEYTRRNIYAQLPMSDNEDCSSYLGIYIAENALSEIFDNIEKMPINNPGFDFICNRRFKIQSKSGILLYHNGSEYRVFNIDYNKIADYFILIAFDNRKDLNPIHIWLIRKDDIVRGRGINQFGSFKITNRVSKLLELKKYEQIDRLEELKEFCKRFKEL